MSDKMVHVGIVEGVAFPLVFKHTYADGVEKDSINLADVHEILGVKTYWSTWVDRALKPLIENGLAVEGVDIEHLSNLKDRNKQHISTIQIAKMVALGSNTRVGLMYAKYLLDLEANFARIKEEAARIKEEATKFLERELGAMGRLIESQRLQIHDLKEMNLIATDLDLKGYSYKEAADTLGIGENTLIEYLIGWEKWLFRKRAPKGRKSGRLYPMERYLNIYVTLDMVNERQTGNRVYRITEKGMRLLFRERDKMYRIIAHVTMVAKGVKGLLPRHVYEVLAASKDLSFPDDESKLEENFPALFTKKREDLN